jgi:endonuclease-3 related protein
MVTPGLCEIVDRLLAHFGPRHWWPAESPFEVMIGAVLTQNTAWGNVEKAISNLKAEKLLNPTVLAELPSEKLQELIKPTGYFRQKERKLRALLEWFIDRYDGSIDALRKVDAEKLRRELLGLWGIGPETADSILCYAVGAPVFVVDAYTVRVLARHGLVPPEADYETVQEPAHSQLPRDTAYLNEAHALFVAVGKRFCRRRLPLCTECPLGSLPHSES